MNKVMLLFYLGVDILVQETISRNENKFMKC